jgi:hypothetical protein
MGLDSFAAGVSSPALDESILADMLCVQAGSMFNQ